MLTARRSTIIKQAFKSGDVVWVPFPFVESPRLRDRPALVVSVEPLGGDANLLWVVMITSAANRGWPDDVSLESNYRECGLEVPCVIRTAKISTVEAIRVRKIGTLPSSLIATVQRMLRRQLGI